jgi:hypothetical protein
MSQVAEGLEHLRRAQATAAEAVAAVKRKPCTGHGGAGAAQARAAEAERQAAEARRQADEAERRATVANERLDGCQRERINRAQEEAERQGREARERELAERTAGGGPLALVTATARYGRAVTAAGSRGNAARPLQATEAEARAALHGFVAAAGVEHRLAEQAWEPVPAGWTVPADLHGWRFRLEHIAGGVRVIMVVREGERADWIVPIK